MDYYRLIILGVMIMIQGCIMAPLTLLSVHEAGMNSLQMWVLVASTFSFLVMGLADQPMKRTIPVFVLGMAVQVALIIINAIA